MAKNSLYKCCILQAVADVSLSPREPSRHQPGQQRRRGRGRRRRSRSRVRRVQLDLGGRPPQAGPAEERADRRHSPGPQEVELARLEPQPQPVRQHPQQKVQLQLVRQLQAPLPGRLCCFLRQPERARPLADTLQVLCKVQEVTFQA